MMISENMDQFGNLSFVGGGGESEPKGRAKTAIIGFSMDLNVLSLVPFAPSPGSLGYDVLNELDPLNDKYIPASSGQYFLRMLVPVATADTGVASWEGHIVKDFGGSNLSLGIKFVSRGASVTSGISLDFSTVASLDFGDTVSFAVKYTTGVTSISLPGDPTGFIECFKL